MMFISVSMFGLFRRFFNTYFFIKSAKTYIYKIYIKLIIDEFIHLVQATFFFLCFVPLMLKIHIFLDMYICMHEFPGIGP